MPAPLVALAYGSNLDRPCGSRQANIVRALELLQQGGFRLEGVSDALPSHPVDCPPGSEDFLNGVCLGRWSSSPLALLHLCQDIEIRLGRAPKGQRALNAPRPIDLDIILFGDLVLDDADLVIPHPRAASRDFVLAPLRSLAPELADRLQRP